MTQAEAKAAEAKAAETKAAGAVRAATVEEQIIQMSMLSYEPMPMLEVIAERLVLSLTSSLKNFTASLVEVNLTRFEYMAYADAMQSLPPHGLIAVCHAEPWDGGLLMSMDSRFLFAALELMLGGQPKRSAARPAPRSFTSIERRMGQKLVEVMLNDLREGFCQITEASFTVERMESNAHFATIAQPASASVRIQLEVSFDGSRGGVWLVIPYSTLDPIRPLLSKVFYGERLGDETWRKHLSDRIENATVTLTALLHERAFPLAEVLGWSVGDTIDLHVEQDHPATVLLADLPMFRGVMGTRQNGATALRVTEDLNGKDELNHAVDAD